MQSFPIPNTEYLVPNTQYLLPIPKHQPATYSPTYYSLLTALNTNDPPETRTPNQLIKSQLLYQLS